MDTPVIQTLKLNDPTLLMDRCFVGGAWVGEPADPVDNPATGEILSRVPRFGAKEATEADYRAAVARGEFDNAWVDRLLTESGVPVELDKSV